LFSVVLPGGYDRPRTDVKSNCTTQDNGYQNRLRGTAKPSLGSLPRNEPGPELPYLFGGASLRGGTCTSSSSLSGSKTVSPCVQPSGRRLDSLLAALARDRYGLRRHWLGLRHVPALVDQQCLGLGRDLPGLLKDQLDRAGPLLAHDEMGTRNDRLSCTDRLV